MHNLKFDQISVTDTIIITEQWASCCIENAYSHSENLRSFSFTIFFSVDPNKFEHTIPILAHLLEKLHSSILLLHVLHRLEDKREKNSNSTLNSLMYFINHNINARQWTRVQIGNREALTGEQSLGNLKTSHSPERGLRTLYHNLNARIDASNIRRNSPQSFHNWFV